MSPAPESGISPSVKPLTTRQAVGIAVMTIACFHAAHSLYDWVYPQLLIVGYVMGLVQLARLSKARYSFYAGFLTAFFCFAPQTLIFWKLFGGFALVLWSILAFWVALFVALTQVTLARFGAKWGAVLVPFLWMGLEYFRCELYYLKFSWLSVGYALTGWDVPLLPFTGTYGIGFLVAAIAGAWLLVRRRVVALIVAVVVLVALRLWMPSSATNSKAPAIRIAGMQMEFRKEPEILAGLDRLITAQPDADLLVLSEYTVSGPLPVSLQKWCQKNRRHLVVGAEDPVGSREYFDTAFVIGPTGEIVFKQAKSVPVQFMNDGLPATRQAVWESPWGKIGICICYDLSYTRVTDELVRQGARIIVAPTMDVAGWGPQEHVTNARVAPARAPEYDVPVFRLASSGISEAVDRDGRIVAMAPYPGPGAIMSAGFALPLDGSLPVDRWAAPFAVGVTGLLLAGHLVWGWIPAARLKRKKDVGSTV